MDIDEFRATLEADAPPAEFSLALQTLWWDAKGNWDRAHACAQCDEGPTGSIVHAYLHRKEGDLSNAKAGTGGRPDRRLRAHCRRSGRRWRLSYWRHTDETSASVIRRLVIRVTGPRWQEFNPRLRRCQARRLPGHEHQAWPTLSVAPPTLIG